MKKSIYKSCIVFPLFVLFLILTNQTRENSFSNKPVIYRISPDKGCVGDEISIFGKNFGYDRKSNKVFFGELSCQDYDFDYIYWSDELIKVKVPTGTNSDNVKVKINEDIAKGPYFKSLNEFSHTYSRPMNLTIDYKLCISSYSYIKNPLYIWVPSSVPSDKQREVKLIKSSDNLLQRQIDDLDLFEISNIESNKAYTVSKRFFFKNYQVVTSIESDKVIKNYNKNTAFYKFYTSPECGIDSNNPRIIETVEYIVGEEKNPYLQAKLIFDWVCENMEYQFPMSSTDKSAGTALNTHVGDCAVYSFLFTALCRAAGIPARPVMGHIIFINDRINVHVWSEFYLEKYGWIPVDPNYGDKQIGGLMPKEFYFGNMDNRHIAFSKGRIQLTLPNDSTIYNRDRDILLTYLQTFYPYSAGYNKNRDFFISWSIHRVY